MARYRLFKKDKLEVRIYELENEMGNASAVLAAAYLNSAIEKQGFANLILATGTSQFSFLEALKHQKTDWNKITVFHLDEYVGITKDHPASFRRYLIDRILKFVKPNKYYLLEGDAKDISGKIKEYENLLQQYPIDLACIGIGENGHIAFNDPPVADFNDPQIVKMVELDQDCRKQQFNEGWFSSLEEVPGMAITLTIPAIMNCKTIICNVPGNRKAEAVNSTLNGPVDTKCPATILRTHPNAILFLDAPALSAVKDKV
ncbi:MAG: glucosamine-6-phosphate deaminase [Ginsengibacter sp.]